MRRFPERSSRVLDALVPRSSRQRRVGPVTRRADRAASSRAEHVEDLSLRPRRRPSRRALAATGTGTYVHIDGCSIMRAHGPDDQVIPAYRAQDDADAGISITARSSTWVWSTLCRLFSIPYVIEPAPEQLDLLLLRLLR